MNEWNFYYPNGEKIEGEDAGKKFVQFYSQIYYYLNRDIGLEKRIEKILKSNDFLDRDDITDILRWKTGGKEEEGYIIVPRTKEDKAISIEKVLYNASEWKKDCCFNGSTEDEKKFEEYWKNLIELKGMGPVYALTILYFISNGKYPIFDRFAYYAITAISENKNLTEFVKDKTLSSIFKQAFYTYKNDYCEKIQNVFADYGYDKDNIFANRDIDRALWVYGHLFNQTKTNEIYKNALKLQLKQ